MDIQNILIVIATIINVLLGFFVLSRNPKDKINRWFGAFVASLVFWCIAMIFYRLTKNNETAFFWLKILYEAPLLIPATLMHFAFTISDGRIALNKSIKAIVWLPVVILGVFTAIDGNIISGVEIIPGQEKIIHWGQYYLVYNIYFITYFSLLFLVLFKKFLASTGIARVQIKFILIGTFAPSILANIANLLLPSFGIFKYNWLGQVMTIPMVVSVMYAVVKHHLLNVKVITTEIFSILVSLVLFVNVLLSKSTNEFILNASLFLAISFFSVMLIRGVLKEVKSREKLAELTSELQKANEDLKKLDKAKSEFISIASHQLRTPLSVIKGYISMLLEGSYGEVPEKGKEILGKMEVNNQRLTNLIDDLLDLSRIEGGRMQFEWAFISFAELVQSVTDDLKMVAEKKGLAFKWINQAPEKMFVRADREKLRQVVMNLIDNAIKYTPQGSVEVKLVKTAGGKARFSVSDTGIGMDKEELAVLFGKFVRGKKTPQLWTEGSGLGLYVAKKIMEEHKGTVWAESEGEGKGSTFYVELPVY